jgi:prolyl oligopeptidase
MALVMTQTMCAHKTRKPDSSHVPANEDENLWLEEVEGQKPLEWVKSHNQKTLAELEGDSRYLPFKEAAEKIAMAQDRIPTGSLRGGYLYNFWQDGKNVRGLWRRTTVAEYKKANPNWEVLLDIDELATKENENWVYKGASCLAPKYERCLISLSRGGKDASVGREFDIVTKDFVANGFYIPEAKYGAVWRDEDTLLIGTDWGKNSLTKSGYPRIVKEWNRGTNLSEARQVFEVTEDSIDGAATTVHRPERTYEFLVENKTFFTSELYTQSKSGKYIKVPVQDDAIFTSVLDGQLIFQLRSPWTIMVSGKQREFKQGSLVSMAYTDIFNEKRDFEVHLIIEPTAISSVNWASDVKDFLYVSTTENVKGRLLRFHFAKGKWSSQPINLPKTGTIDLISANSYENTLLVSFEGFIESDRLFMINDSKVELLKSEPERFDAKGLVVTQNFAISKDGTRVPYFIVAKKNIKRNGKNPTLLYGYGGFENSLTPYYTGIYGKLWMERGGVYVVANIRGGGEYGPAWHQAAIGKNRQRAFDDFIAVGEDLIKRKITSPKHLGSMGGSNGGLLVGATFVQRPDLFGAIVCQVPLLDMLRYHKLLAGASWMGEYGNPDVPEERKYLLAYSPYQNLKPNVAYPKVFFLTSTKDDRVHPGHARKMVARMEALGSSVYYYENTDGGHSAAANLKEKARRSALEVVYLSRLLGLEN